MLAPHYAERKLQKPGLAVKGDELSWDVGVVLFGVLRVY